MIFRHDDEGVRAAAAAAAVVGAAADAAAVGLVARRHRGQLGRAVG